MDNQRFRIEYCVLLAQGPTWPFRFIRDPRLRLEVVPPISIGGVKLKGYTVKIYGLEDFPEEEPIVTPGVMLRDHNGEEMTEPSRANHVIGEYNGETHLCIYSEWNPDCSLYKTAARAAVWLAAYYFHMKTGRSIDSYIPH